MADVRALIRMMAQANPRWGAPRIHALLKLGIDVCQAIVAKYMGRRRQPPSQTWRTLLQNHVGQIVAADFFVVPTATYRLLFVLVFLAHDRRRIRHAAVTAHPTAAWTAQQLREAFSWDEAPRSLIYDHDHAFDSLRATAKAMGIEEVLTAPAGQNRSLTIRFLTGFFGSQDAQNWACFLKFSRHDAHSSHRDHFVHPIVITRSSDRDRSEATRGTSAL
jgi:hypothetical protein